MHIGFARIACLPVALALMAWIAAPATGGGGPARPTGETEQSQSDNTAMPELQTVRELTAPGTVSALVWSPDGSRLLAASLGSADEPKIFHVPSPFGHRIAIFGADGDMVRLIERPGSFFGEQDTFSFVTGNGQIITPAGDSSTLALHVFDIATGETARDVAGPHPDTPQKLNRISRLATSPDQSVVAVAFARPQPIALYSTKDWSKLADLPDGPGSLAEQPHALAFSPDGRWLAAALGKRTAIYDLVSRQMVRRIEAFETYSADVAFSPDNSNIAIASPQGVRVFRAADGTPLAAYSRPFSPTGGLAWSADGRFIAFISNYRRLHLWDPLRGGNDRSVEVGARSAFCLAISPDARNLAVNIDRTIRIFSVSYK